MEELLISQPGCVEELGSDLRTELLNDGLRIYHLAERLFPICRSITGNGVRETLEILKEEMRGLQVFEVPTGTRCFDWTVPKEWTIRDAWIIGPDGEKVVDFKRSNLHVVGYSCPLDTDMTLEELQPHLYSLPDQPDAVPYVTSYYKERWGFCLSENTRKCLKPGRYHVKIDSDLKNGSLTYGELILPGESQKEVFLSTYVCHPSLANNELSGPCVTTFLAKWLHSLQRRKYTYRIVFIPETIGSIVYLSRHHETLKQRVIAGFNVTCIGDDRSYSYLPSRRGNTLADQVAQHVLNVIAPRFKRYSYLDRGSDERQYCSPGIDLPVASIMRSRYDSYPEYHTSLDNLTLISPEGLFGGYVALVKSIECLEKNCRPKSLVLCEPQLGKRGLYPDISMKGSGNTLQNMMNLIAYCDGEKSLLEIATLIGAPLWVLRTYIDKLVEENIIALTES